MECHTLHQGIFPTQGSSPASRALQAVSLPLSHWRKLHLMYTIFIIENITFMVLIDLLTVVFIFKFCIHQCSLPFSDIFRLIQFLLFQLFFLFSNLKLCFLSNNCNFIKMRLDVIIFSMLPKISLCIKIWEIIHHLYL